ncbi:PAT complex subunit Asterix-like [Halichondria panicea]|uniref:PAT complex subunit Asterix-like n=1 Tax=Halichondria panicea TaxID=6063 RepID=UPI00312B4F18
MAPSDPRRPDKVYRYPKNAQAVGGSAEYFNAIGMVCSLVGLLMKMKWASWIGVCCSVMYLANSKTAEDKKTMISLFMLASSSLVMVYMQAPSPMTLPFT